MSSLSGPLSLVRAGGDGTPGPLDLMVEITEEMNESSVTTATASTATTSKVTNGDLRARQRSSGSTPGAECGARYCGPAGWVSVMVCALGSLKGSGAVRRSAAQ